MAATFSNIKGTTSGTFRVGKSGLQLSQNSILSADSLNLSSDSNIVNVDVTGYIKLPSGTTDERPIGVNGAIRYNSTESRVELFQDSVWKPLVSSTAGSTGATGGGTNKIFWENDSVITENYTITENKNAGTFGPVSIADGVEITVPSGSVWTIV